MTKPPLVASGKAPSLLILCPWDSSRKKREHKEIGEHQKYVDRLKLASQNKDMQMTSWS